MILQGRCLGKNLTGIVIFNNDTDVADHAQNHYHQDNIILPITPYDEDFA